MTTLAKNPALPLSMRLAHIATAYDRKQEEAARRNPKRRYHNPSALPLYLARCDEVADMVAAGKSLQAALRECFNDRLLAYFEKQLAIPNEGDTK